MNDLDWKLETLNAACHAFTKWSHSTFTTTFINLRSLIVQCLISVLADLDTMEKYLILQIMLSSQLKSQMKNKP